MPKLCEAPDHHVGTPHPAYQRFGYFVVVAPKKAYWFYACEDYLKYIKHEIAMGRSQMAVMKARSIGQ